MVSEALSAHGGELAILLFADGLLYAKANFHWPPQKIVASESVGGSAGVKPARKMSNYRFILTCEDSHQNIALGEGNAGNV